MTIMSDELLAIMSTFAILTDTHEKVYEIWKISSTHNQHIIQTEAERNKTILKAIHATIGTQTLQTGTWAIARWCH